MLDVQKGDMPSCKASGDFLFSFIYEEMVIYVFVCQRERKLDQQTQ